MALPGSIKGYLRDRNSVDAITFELDKPLPRTPPLSYSDEDDLVLVQSLLKKHPDATLKRLCGYLHTEYHITVTISNMSRAVQRLGYRGRADGVNGCRLAA